MENSSPIEELYRRYAKSVKLYALTLCENHATADDITAETFLKAIKSIDTFQDGNIFTWLCTIAKHTYFDQLRKKEHANLPLSEELSQTLADTRQTPEEEAIEQDEKLTLYRLLQSLEAEAREVVYFRLFTDLTFREIGSILGRSENWARIVFYHSKNKLKGWLDHETPLGL